MVAIVDDDAAIREATETLLRSAGYTAETYASAEEFLNAVPPSAAGCLILDVGLPGMSGPALQTHLSAGGRCLPIVFITSCDDPGGRIRARALQQGALAFLPKPFGDTDLLDAVRRSVSPNG